MVCSIAKKGWYAYICISTCGRSSVQWKSSKCLCYVDTSREGNFPQLWKMCGMSKSVESEKLICSTFFLVFKGVGKDLREKGSHLRNFPKSKVQMQSVVSSRPGWKTRVARLMGSGHEDEKAKQPISPCPLPPLVKSAYHFTHSLFHVQSQGQIWY